MDRFAVFIDAGYLFAAGSILLTGEKKPRSELRLENEIVLQDLITFGQERSGRDLLRLYWYDGTSSGPTAHQLSLANLDNVKLRLGLVNSSGEQKGVDSLIITDMIALARNRAMSDAILLAGDEDLRVGVQQAQEYGVRVHLLGIAPSERNQSQLMRQEVDTRREWDAALVATFLTHQPRVIPATPPPLPTAGAIVTALVQRAVDTLTPDELAATLSSYAANRGIPQDIDRRLLADARGEYGRDLSQPEKRALRADFINACQQVSPPQQTPAP